MTTATAKIMNQFERRPTYNELVEMIEEEELKVKPSIENLAACGRAFAIVCRAIGVVRSRS